MAKKESKDKKLLAKLVTESNDRKPCSFCQREIDDEVTYGKLYSIGNIQCHYFCVLLSCCLVQKGKDEEGLFGFLYPDILAELERSKKHRCSYCGRGGATLGCSLSQCRKQFHLPCGRERNAVSLFYGNFKSFCEKHAPKQKVAEDVMSKAKLRMAADRKTSKTVVPKTAENGDDCLAEDSLCVICYEQVPCYPTPVTFWPPCCARDKWFHRSCLQRMALSAGMHYLKCPLCNDKDRFYQAVISQGYYVPDRDAAWELEQNAFAEIYERELTCSMPECHCPLGRDHDSDNGPWDILLCLLCGSICAHARCLERSLLPEDAEGGRRNRFVCAVCRPAAPGDLEGLAARVERVVLASQANVTRRGPVMPSRMSLRRTKQRQEYYRNSSSSSQSNVETDRHTEAISNNVTTSRQDLNLKTPKRYQKEASTTILRDVHENELLSPTKLIEQGFREKIKNIVGITDVAIEPSVLENFRRKFRKPKPWSEKKKIVDGILEDLVSDAIKQKKPKAKEPVREWLSPKKGSLNNNENQQPQLETEPIILEETKVEVITTPKKSRSCTPLKIVNQSPSKIEDKTPQKNCQNTDIEIHSTPEKNIEPPVLEDEETSSTFKLPPEFIAEDSNITPIFDTPKKLKTVEIQKDSSMEISEDNDVVNIDLVKIENANSLVLSFPILKTPVKTEKCALKISPKDKESLGRNQIDIDLESFKNQYLNEVDRDFKCKFSHKHSYEKTSFKLQSAIDFAIDATSKERKRKIKPKKKSSKRRKLESGESVIKSKKSEIKTKFKIKLGKKSKNHRKYVWKSESSIKISPSKTEAHKTLKQYILKYATPGEIVKPDREVTPIKKKHFKNDRSPDNLIQTSIQSFFMSNPK